MFYVDIVESAGLSFFRRISSLNIETFELRPCVFLFFLSAYRAAPRSIDDVPLFLAQATSFFDHSILFCTHRPSSCASTLFGIPRPWNDHLVAYSLSFVIFNYMIQWSR